MYENTDIEALERQFNVAMEEADTGSALEAIRRLYAELYRGEADSVSAIAHKELEVEMRGLFLEGKSYRGVRGFLNWRKDMSKLFEEERFQPVGIRFAGRDRWVVLGRLHVKQADDGTDLDVPLAHAVEQRDRKLAKITVYSDISAALESFGLPE